METALRFYLLGRFEVYLGGELVIDEDWPRTKAKSLLKILALAGGKWLHREQLLDLLWPDLPPDAASNNFRQALHYIRAEFSRLDSTSPVVSLGGNAFGLTPDALIDFEEFEKVGMQALALKTDDQVYEVAARFYQGDLLPSDLYEPWTEPARSDLWALSRELMIAQAKLAEIRGKSQEAEKYLHRLLDADKLDEEAHRELMRVYARVGRLDRARSQYQTCRTLLVEELGTEPSQETSELLESLCRGARPEVKVLVPGRYAGRPELLSELRKAVDEAMAGQGQLAILSGEPGIGKTRTARAVAAYASMSGFEVLWGRCHEDDGAPPLWPWQQIVRDCRDLSPGDDFVSPEVLSLMEGAPRDLHDQRDRFGLFFGIADLFRGLARRQPLVIVVEDIHRSDEAGLLLLQTLSRELRRTRLIIVATYRDSQAEARELLRTTLGQLERESPGCGKRLRRLTQAEVGELFVGLTNKFPAERLLQYLYGATDGNPLFVKETVHWLEGEGRSQELDQNHRPPVPPAIADVILARCARLPADTRRLLGIASVLGREFDSELLRRVLDKEGIKLHDPLQPAIDHQLVEEMHDNSGRRRVRFTHALVGESLYGELTTNERVRLHDRAASAIDELYPGDPDHFAEAAHHAVESAGFDKRRAIECCRKAAQHASDLYSYEEAVRFYSIALDLLGKGVQDRRLRAELAVSRGEALARSGELEAARNAIQEGVEVARSLDDGALLSRAALAFDSRFVWNSEDLPATVALLEQAEAATREQVTSERVKVLARLAMLKPEVEMLRHAGATHSRRAEKELLARPDTQVTFFKKVNRLASEAVRLARQLDDPSTLAFALDARYMAIWGPDTIEERVKIADEIIQLTDEAGDMERAHQAHHWRCVALMEMGDLRTADYELEAQVRLSELLKQPAQLGYTRITQATRAALAGDFQHAETLAGECLSVTEAAEPTIAYRWYLPLMFLIRHEQADLPPASPFFDPWLKESPDPTSASFEAYLALEAGNEDDCRKQIEQVWPVERLEGLPRDYWWLGTVGILSETLSRLGDVERCCVLYDRLLPDHDKLILFAPVFCTGFASRNLGLLAVALGEWDQAAQHFQKAIEDNARIGARPWVAWSKLGYAEVLLRQSRNDQTARQLVKEAVEDAKEMGMERLLRAANGLWPTEDSPGLALVP